MRYYKVILENGEEYYHESKRPLDEPDLIKAMLEEATLSPAETDDIEMIEEIDEEEYAECV
jgi:hypothetical protein